MALTLVRKHGPYGVGLGATLLGGITRQSIATGTQVKAEPTSGEVWARIIAMYAQKVMPSFTTYNLATALGAAGVSGASIADMVGGLALYAQKHLAGGARVSGANHRKYGFTAGILAPKTLSADHRGDATLTYDAAVTWDGTNDPLTITDSASLPGSLADAERFTMGPATVGAVLLPEKTSVSIEFGLDVVTEGADSSIWDEFASIRMQQSVWTFRGLDIEWLKAANFPLAGKAATNANSTIYFRKRADGGTFVADGTAQHIKFTTTGLAYIDTAFDADNQKAGETVLKVVTKYDGTNAPVICTPNSAIT